MDPTCNLSAHLTPSRCFERVYIGRTHRAPSSRSFIRNDGMTQPSCPRSAECTALAFHKLQGVPPLKPPPTGVVAPRRSVVARRRSASTGRRDATRTSLLRCWLMTTTPRTRLARSLLPCRCSRSRLLLRFPPTPRTLPRPMRAWLHLPPTRHPQPAGRRCRTLRAARSTTTTPQRYRAPGHGRQRA